MLVNATPSQKKLLLFLSCNTSRWLDWSMVSRLATVISGTDNTERCQWETEELFFNYLYIFIGETTRYIGQTNTIPKCQFQQRPEAIQYVLHSFICIWHEYNVKWLFIHIQYLLHSFICIWHEYNVKWLFIHIQYLLHSFICIWHVYNVKWLFILAFVHHRISDHNYLNQWWPSLLTQNTGHSASMSYK